MAKPHNPPQLLTEAADAEAFKLVRATPSATFGIDAAGCSGTTEMLVTLKTIPRQHQLWCL
jgi:hypothetical protein